MRQLDVVKLCCFAGLHVPRLGHDDDHDKLLVVGC